MTNKTMRTKEQIINSMMDEMPFELSENIKPYIIEVMEIYAKEVISNNVIHDVSRCDFKGVDVYYEDKKYGKYKLWNYCKDRCKFFLTGGGHGFYADAFKIISCD